MTLTEWFEKGLTYEQYRQAMAVNGEGMDSIMARFSLPDREKEKLANVKAEKLRAIVLTEDWCGDAMLNNPILIKIAEEAGIEVRFLLRDSNLELMDQYLTNGTARSIPIFIFIDQNGAERAVWGPRAPEIQKIVDEERAQLPDKEDPDFKEKQKGMIGRLTKAYVEDEKIWETVARSIVHKLAGA
ncbi:thioredoxin family protein [Bacillus sp. V3-13]|uniref:thioredoxin family protein n=1 Tax=Bacillus sp. V3-13 TaxID=2053728 RepID=UPI000C76F7FA|nr:thioredoxin family protein [Bacillus sp. V3-13]PLR75705.1 thioredoxin family protein [Bacillus sp. V3-13]